MARKAKKKAAEAFYAQALSQAEQVELGQAWDVEGLDEEIALLRLRIRRKKKAPWSGANIAVGFEITVLGPESME